VQKSGKKVAYGTELTIDERVLSAPLRQQVGKDGARYELFGGASSLSPSRSHVLLCSKTAC